MSEVTSEQKKEDWMNSKWRPMMGWMYMVVCMMDMVVFPILWSLLQTFTHTAITQWNPLTLQGAGLFHIAMGAVLGIAAFGRTQEKLNGANNGGAQVPTTGFASGSPTPSIPSTGGFGAPSSFNSPAPSSFGGSGFGGAPTAPTTSYTPPASWGTTPIATTASGKKLVPDEPQPAI
jgi:Holin of 3TMs, for gene-transfer release